MHLFLLIFSVSMFIGTAALAEVENSDVEYCYTHTKGRSNYTDCLENHFSNLDLRRVELEQEMHAEAKDMAYNDEIHADLQELSLNSQKLYEVYRDTECERQANKYGTGNFRPAGKFICLLELTQDRIDILAEYKKDKSECQN